MGWRENLKRLWTPAPLPSSVAYVHVNTKGEVCWPSSGHPAQVYILLEPECYTLRYFTFEALSWLRRWWCVVWGGLQSLSFRSSEVLKFSRWMHNTRRWQSLLSYQSIQVSQAWLNTLVRSLPPASCFMGIYPLGPVLLEALRADLKIAENETYWVARIHPSGHYEEWLMQGKALVRHKTFLLPPQAQEALGHPRTGAPFIRDKMVQTLEEISLSGLAIPRTLVVLWPFEDDSPSHVLQESTLLLWHETSALKRLFARTPPDSAWALSHGTLARWHAQRKTWRRLGILSTSVAIVLSVGSGLYVYQDHRQMKHQEHALALQKRLLKEEIQPFCEQYGLGDADWSPLLGHLDKMAHAFHSVRHMVRQQCSITQIGSCVEQVLETYPLLNVRMEVTPQGVQVTSEGSPQAHDALLHRFKELGPVGPCVRSDVVSSSPPHEALNLLHAPPEPIEQFHITMPIPE